MVARRFGSTATGACTGAFIVTTVQVSLPGEQQSRALAVFHTVVE
jgi:hypothetical protein